MNLFALSCLLLLIPLLFQIILGTRAIFKKTFIAFEYCCISSCIAEFIVLYFALKIIAIDAKNQNVNCGIPQASLFVFGFFVLFLLLITTIIQIVIRRKIKK